MDKIITVLGTRPEIIRLSRIIPKLDKVCKHIIIHTGQNFDPKLSDIFFKDLGIRKPDYYLGARGSMGEQIATILREVENIFIKEKPDKVLILGDTNSGLSAIIAERMGIKVYHLESGNRCYDKEVPEEINRKIIDHVSTYNFPYTPGSRRNLFKEGIDRKKIIMSGNPIREVIKHYGTKIQSSKILKKLKLKPKTYFLATFHRQECVDIKEKLEQIIQGLVRVAIKYSMPIVLSVHPRTKEKLKELNTIPNYIMLCDPFSFFDFVKLEKNALAIISDSGTVCEEGTILRTPTVICRDSTERPETIEVGSAILSGISGENILKCTELMVASKRDWNMPEGYMDLNVSDKVIKYLLGRI